MFYFINDYSNTEVVLIFILASVKLNITEFALIIMMSPNFLYYASENLWLVPHVLIITIYDF